MNRTGECIPAGLEVFLDDDSSDSWSGEGEECHDDEYDLNFSWRYSKYVTRNEEPEVFNIGDDRDLQSSNVSLRVFEESQMNDSFNWSKNAFDKVKELMKKRQSKNLNPNLLETLSPNFQSVHNKNNKVPLDNLHDSTSNMASKADAIIGHNLDEILDQFKERGIPNENVLDRLVEQWQSTNIPYDFVLYIMEESHTLQYSHRAKFLSMVLKSVERWKEEFERKESMKEPSDAVRLGAVRLYVDCPVSLDMGKMKTIFQLGSPEDKNDYKALVTRLLNKHEYVKASRCITAIKDHKLFNCVEICLSLVCQGHIAELERFMNDQPILQGSFIKLIDSYVADDRKLVEFYENSKIARVRKLQLDHKSLFKLGLRIVRKHQLDESICPNIVFHQSSKAVKFLIIKRFILKEMACREWEELIDVAVAKDPKLQFYLVQQLLDRYEEEVAVAMAAKYKVPEKQLPELLQPKVKELIKKWKGKSAVCPEQMRVLGFEEKHHTLSLDPSNIHWVDKRGLFVKAKEMLLISGSKFIAFDSEWRPTFTNVVLKSKLSLIQLATEHNVFILDVFTLLSILKEDEWIDFFEKLFCDIHVLVIGYALREDISMLHTTFPYAKEKIGRFNFLDLEDVHEKLLDQRLMIDGWISDDRGLSDLVARCLGKPLDKSQQISDWGKRPLREQQLSYAALDVYCVIEIYMFLMANNFSILSNVMEDGDLRLSHINESILKADLRSRKRRSNEGVKNRTIISMTKKNSRPVSQLRFICDSTLHTLGKQLRFYGVDTHLMSEEEEDLMAVDISKKESRIILAAGMALEFLRKMIEDRMCYGVRGMTLQEQLLDIFETFDIRVRPEDLYSRCQACNCKEQVILPPAEVKMLWMKKRELLQIETTSGEEVNPYKRFSINELPRYRNLRNDMKNHSILVKEVLEAEKENIVTVNHSRRISRRTSSAYTQETYDDERPSEHTKFDDSDELSDAEIENVHHHKSSLDMIDRENVKIKSTGMPIQCEFLPEKLLNAGLSEFFICTGCGKVSWDAFKEKESKFAIILGKIK